MLDVNECREEVDECDQDCKNTVGSYVCDCSSGFLLDPNGKSCNGKLPQITPLSFVPRPLPLKMWEWSGDEATTTINY